jgi:hypothetical protein
LPVIFDIGVCHLKKEFAATCCSWKPPNLYDNTISNVLYNTSALFDGHSQSFAFFFPAFRAFIDRNALSVTGNRRIRVALGDRPEPFRGHESPTPAQLWPLGEGTGTAVEY